MSSNRRQAVSDLPAATDVSQDGFLFQNILVLGFEVVFHVTSIAHKDDRSGDVGPLCLTQGECQKLRYHLERLSKTLTSVGRLKLLKNFGIICYFLKIRHLEEILHPQIIEFIGLFC